MIIERYRLSPPFWIEKYSVTWHVSCFGSSGSMWVYQKFSWSTWKKHVLIVLVDGSSFHLFIATWWINLGIAPGSTGQSRVECYCYPLWPVFYPQIESKSCRGYHNAQQLFLPSHQYSRKRVPIRAIYVSRSLEWIALRNFTKWPSHLTSRSLSMIDWDSGCP